MNWYEPNTTGFIVTTTRVNPVTDSLIVYSLVHLVSCKDEHYSTCEPMHVCVCTFYLSSLTRNICEQLLKKMSVHFMTTGKSCRITFLFIVGLSQPVIEVMLVII